MNNNVLHCFAAGREGNWEAVCLDFDIAVQGESLREVDRALGNAIQLYIETIRDLPAADRRALLNRRAPLSVWAKWYGGYYWYCLTGGPSAHDDNVGNTRLSIHCPAPT